MQIEFARPNAEDDVRTFEVAEGFSIQVAYVSGEELRKMGDDSSSRKYIRGRSVDKIDPRKLRNRFISKKVRGWEVTHEGLHSVVPYSPKTLKDLEEAGTSMKAEIPYSEELLRQVLTLNVNVENDIYAFATTVSNYVPIEEKVTEDDLKN